MPAANASSVLRASLPEGAAFVWAEVDGDAAEATFREPANALGAIDVKQLAVSGRGDASAGDLGDAWRGNGTA